MSKRIKFLLGGMLLIAIISGMSCRKDYTCTCSKIYKNKTGSNIRDYSVKTYRGTRATAEEKCKANTDAGSDDTGNYSMNCQLEC